MPRRLLALCFIVLGAANLRADDKKADEKAQEELWKKRLEGFAARERAREDKAEEAMKELEAVTKELKLHSDLSQMLFEVWRARIEIEALKKRNAELEKELLELKKQIAEQQKKLVGARNEAKLAEAIADDNAKKELEFFLAPFQPEPPAILPNLRGSVTQVSGNLVTLDIGIDTGLGVGSVLDIYRLDGGGRYLGTLKVTTALNLFPKQAILTFTPAKNVPLERLRVEDLPRKGDEVRPPKALTGDK